MARRPSGKPADLHTVLRAVFGGIPIMISGMTIPPLMAFALRATGHPEALAVAGLVLMALTLGKLLRTNGPLGGWRAVTLLVTLLFVVHPVHALSPWLSRQSTIGVVIMAIAATQMLPLWALVKPRTLWHFVPVIEGFRAVVAGNPFAIFANAMAASLFVTCMATLSEVAWGEDGMMVAFAFVHMMVWLLTIGWVVMRKNGVVMFVSRMGHTFRVGGRSVLLTPDLPIQIEPGGRLRVGELVVVQDDPAGLAWLEADLRAHRLSTTNAAPTDEAAKLAGRASAARGWHRGPEPG